MRSRTWEPRRLLAVLVLCSVFAASCGDSDEGAGEGGADGAGGAGAPSGQTTEGSAVEGEADPSADLTIAFHLALPTMDPHQVATGQTVAYLLPMFDTLITLTPEGELEPGLASSWEWSDDGLQFTMELEEGVTFHDGSQMDAEVVKANLDRLLAVETSPVKGLVANVSSVEATGPMTVTLNMTQPDATIPYALAERPGMMISGEAIAGGVDLATTAVGAGPYRVTEFRPNDRLKYERFDDYWGDPAMAAAQTLEVIGIPDGQARLNGITSGQFDAAYITATQASQVEAAGLHLEEHIATYYIQLYLNRTRSEFDDVQVRRAIAHALDREAMCQFVYFERCEVASQPFPEGHWAHNPDIGPDYYPYDPERARELLAEAGVPDGFAFEMMIPAASDPYPQLAELIQSQLAEVGITANINPVDISQLATSFMAEGNSDALIGGGGQQAEPTNLFAQVWTSTAFANPGGHTAEGMDELVAEMRATLDQEERAALVREGVQLAVDEVLNVIMYKPSILWAMDENVVGWRNNQIANYPFFNGVGLSSAD